jgi:hypothetical protein
MPGLSQTKIHVVRIEIDEKRRKIVYTAEGIVEYPRILSVKGE